MLSNECKKTKSEEQVSKKGPIERTTKDVFKHIFEECTDKQTLLKGTRDDNRLYKHSNLQAYGGKGCIFLESGPASCP